MPSDAITLSLISHTNVGKTTLARTLLRRDVGDTLDQEHVTDVATAYQMIESGGRRLLLWDTPGFGSTPKLLKRLRLSGSPIRWMITQLWDRFREGACEGVGLALVQRRELLASEIPLVVEVQRLAPCRLTARHGAHTGVSDATRPWSSAGVDVE